MIVIETLRIALALLALLVPMQRYANTHDLDVSYRTTIHGPRGACHIVVWTNGDQGAEAGRDYTWVSLNDALAGRTIEHDDDEDPACWDIGDLVRENVLENNAPENH